MKNQSFSKRHGVFLLLLETMVPRMYPVQLPRVQLIGSKERRSLLDLLSEQTLDPWRYLEKIKIRDWNRTSSSLKRAERLNESQGTSWNSLVGFLSSAFPSSCSFRRVGNCFWRQYNSAFLHLIRTGAREGSINHDA